MLGGTYTITWKGVEVFETAFSRINRCQSGYHHEAATGLLQLDA